MDLGCECCEYMESWDFAEIDETPSFREHETISERSKKHVGFWSPSEKEITKRFRWTGCSPPKMPPISNLAIMDIATHFESEEHDSTDVLEHFDGVATKIAERIILEAPDSPAYTIKPEVLVAVYERAGHWHMRVVCKWDFAPYLDEMSLTRIAKFLHTCYKRVHSITANVEGIVEKGHLSDRVMLQTLAQVYNEAGIKTITKDGKVKLKYPNKPALKGIENQCDTLVEYPEVENVISTCSVCGKDGKWSLPCCLCRWYASEHGYPHFRALDKRFQSIEEPVFWTGAAWREFTSRRHKMLGRVLTSDFKAVIIWTYMKTRGYENFVAFLNDHPEKRNILKRANFYNQFTKAYKVIIDGKEYMVKPGTGESGGTYKGVAGKVEMILKYTLPHVLVDDSDETLVWKRRFPYPSIGATYSAAIRSMKRGIKPGVYLSKKSTVFQCGNTEWEYMGDECINCFKKEPGDWVFNNEIYAHEEEEGYYVGGSFFETFASANKVAKVWHTLFIDCGILKGGPTHADKMWGFPAPAIPETASDDSDKNEDTGI